MVAFVDPRSKRIIECNDILPQSIGCKKKSLIGRSIFALHSESCRQSAEEVYNTFLRTKSVPDAELQLQKKNGGTISVSLRISGSEDERGRTLCTRFSWHNMTERKRVHEKLEDEKRQLKKRILTGLTALRKTKKVAVAERKKRKIALTKVAQAVRVLREQRRDLRRLAGRLISVQEDERRRLARDLHDDTCQKLGMLGFQLEKLQHDLPSSSDAIRKELQSLHLKITALANDIRSLSHQLHPAILDYLGLVKALEAYIEDFTQRQNLKTDLIHNNIPQNLHPKIASTLYRVTQECLGNSAKHAKATKIIVSLHGFTKSLRLVIRDNGVGLSKKQLVALEQGLGFISMQERLRLLKGTLTVQTKPKHGAEIIVRIPYAKSPS